LWIAKLTKMTLDTTLLFTVHGEYLINMEILRIIDYTIGYEF